MPTFTRTPRFIDDFKHLVPANQERFMTVVRKEFVIDLKTRSLRPGLRVKRVKSTPGVWEMTWAPDGRATFEYGDEQRPGEQHVIWRRVGTHDILRNP
jgi:hypothetical protein